jgi:tetratricopeptide (TPR) repeat protein
VHKISHGWRTSLVRIVVFVTLSALTAWNVTSSGALENARLAYTRGDLNHCARQALDHLRRQPWSREAALLAARSFSRLDYADLAERYFQRAGSLTLSDLQLRAFGLARSPHPQQAIPAYDDILVKWPDNVTALRRLAAVLLAENRTADSLKLADRLAQTSTGAVIGATIRGVVYHNDDNPQAAVSAFEQVLKLDPELREMPLPRRLFWTHFASDLIAAGRLEEAGKHLSTAVAATDDFDLMNQLGRVYFLQGAFDDAERCYRQATEWAPNEYGPLLSLARLAQQQRKFPEALEYLTKARLLAPLHYDVLYSLASVYRQLGRAAEAEQILAIIKEWQIQRNQTSRPVSGTWPRYAL